MWRSGPPSRSGDHSRPGWDPRRRSGSSTAASHLRRLRSSLVPNHRCSGPIWHETQAGLAPGIGPWRGYQALDLDHSSCFFQLWIWFGCTPKCTANSTMGAVAPYSRHRHLSLERRVVLLPCPLHVLLPRYPRFLGAGLHLSHLSHFRGPAQSRFPRQVKFSACRGDPPRSETHRADRDAADRTDLSRWMGPSTTDCSLITQNPEVCLSDDQPGRAGWRVRRARGWASRLLRMSSIAFARP